MFADLYGKRKKQLAPKGPVEKYRRRKLCGTDPPPFGVSVDSRSTAGENFVVLIRHLLVCHMTADELQPHIRILKQLMKQRQSLQKKSASRKRDPAYQREKLLGYLKTANSLFCVPMAFSNQAASSHMPMCKRSSCPSWGCAGKIRKNSQKLSSQ
ncbi:hypothetical protein PoB_002313500 [Plakobranchus ocellatus]|uniref:40S ribosomal protein S15 n=1 Tax=Plakobranchus ocellatus TaxID=259542 RepID=A0AAV3ZNB2_9GAST|nr:hypothetical protein PoB_002313500 [Plakobranchus ocellatus]